MTNSKIGKEEWKMNKEKKTVGKREEKTDRQTDRGGTSMSHNQRWRQK